MTVVVRPERPGDEIAIRAVHEAAFGGPVEAGIVDAVRGTDAWLPDLSLVAEHDGERVGHVLVCRGWLERPGGPDAKVLVLGPIGIVPQRQRAGIGGALMRRAIGAAVRRAEPLIALLGHPDYYARFGFRPGRQVGIEPPAPWPDASWMVLLLPTWTPDLRGTVRYPAAYPLD